MCNATTVIGNKVIGFGETGDQSNVSGGIVIESTHASQALSAGSLVETGNSVLVTVGATLSVFWQPGASLCIGGATTTGYNICGILLNTSYSRLGGTFTLYNPTGSLASCSGACTASAIIYAENSNNVFSSNQINLPCQGTLTNNRYGMMIRVTGANEVANYNKYNNNTITGCGNGATGDVGIRSTGTGSGVEDSNTYNDNKLVNLSVGYLITEGTTFFIRNTEYINVATPFSSTGSGWTFAEEDFGTQFANLVACTTPLLGKTAEVTNSNTLVFGATVAAGGANHVLARCSQTGVWTVAGN